MTPADVHDSVPADDLVRGDQAAVYADKATTALSAGSAKSSGCGAVGWSGWHSFRPLSFGAGWAAVVGSPWSSSGVAGTSSKSSGPGTVCMMAPPQEPKERSGCLGCWSPRPGSDQ